MYMDMVISTLTQAVKNTFNENYPVPEFSNLHISPEFPELRADYPAVWVDFEPVGELETGGISQLLFVDPYSGNAVPGGMKIWLFRGYATYTIMALTSLERDRLFDELVKMIAFGSLNPQLSVYRQTIEQNPWIAMNVNFDQIDQRNKSASGGTPWGTDDMLYEITVAVSCLGEFASDPGTGEFVDLSEIKITPTIAEIEPV